MHVSIRILSALWICGACVSPALAWSPASRVQMLDQALRLLPESLRSALQGYHEELRRGMLEPMLDEDGPAHRAPWDDGHLDSTVDAEIEALVSALRKGSDFDEISRRFGRVAHFVLDAGFPPAMGDDGSARYAHFGGYCEAKLSKFPLVFYGHDDESDTVVYRDRALQTMSRARDDDRLLARAYAAAGDPPDPAHFGDRSVPFAVGSLSYSHGVTNIVRMWLGAWRQAGGDMGRTPFLGMDLELKK